MKQILWAALLLLACKRDVAPAGNPAEADPTAAARAALASLNAATIPVWTDRQVKELNWTGVASQDADLCLSHRKPSGSKKPADEFERHEQELKDQAAGSVCKQEMEAKLKNAMRDTAIVEVALDAGEYSFTDGAFTLEFLKTDEGNAKNTYLDVSDVSAPNVLLSSPLGAFLLLSAKDMGKAAGPSKIAKRGYTLRLPEGEARAIKPRLASKAGHLRMQFVFRPLGWGDTGLRVRTGKIDAVKGDALGMRVIDDTGEITPWEPLL